MSLANELTQGIGGLKFVATSPPGEGRLIRIPFYLESAAIGFDAMVPGAADATAGGASGTASTQSPVILVSPPNAINTTPSVALKTPQISWATLRIVGFEVSKSAGALPGTLDAMGQAEIIFKDLQIGGGANLFVHEDYASSSLYDCTNDSFAGLRDYPVLKSPNVAEVTVGIKTGVASGGTTFAQNAAGVSASILFSCNLVCEILQDDNYGAGVPGPYARQMAMRR